MVDSRADHNFIDKEIVANAKVYMSLCTRPKELVPSMGAAKSLLHTRVLLSLALSVTIRRTPGFWSFLLFLSLLFLDYLG